MVPQNLQKPTEIGKMTKRQSLDEEKRYTEEQVLILQFRGKFIW